MRELIKTEFGKRRLDITMLWKSVSQDLHKYYSFLYFFLCIFLFLEYLGSQVFKRLNHPRNTINIACHFNGFIGFLSRHQAHQEYF